MLAAGLKNTHKKDEPFLCVTNLILSRLWKQGGGTTSDLPSSGSHEKIRSLLQSANQIVQPGPEWLPHRL